MDAPTTLGSCGGRPHLRKRGEALEDAIIEGAYAELSEVGYARFSIEGVAARAQTGKASIYRRWPSKQDLLLDVLCARLPGPQQCGLQPELDETVTTADALRQMARSISHVLDSPAGDAMRAVKCEAVTDPRLALAIDERFQAPRRTAILDLLRRGVARGEVRPGAACELVADVLPAVLMHRIILQRKPLTEEDLRDVIEQVLIPLISSR